MRLDIVVTAKRNARHFIVLIFYTIEFREAERVRAGCPSYIVAFSISLNAGPPLGANLHPRMIRVSSVWLAYLVNIAHRRYTSQNRSRPSFYPPIYPRSTSVRVNRTRSL